MQLGWHIIWRKHHWGIIIFVLVTLLLNASSVASLYSEAAAQHQTLPEYVRQITFGGRSPFADGFLLLLLLAIIVNSQLHQDLQRAGLSNQDRWRFMGQLALAGAMWLATLGTMSQTLMYRFYTDTLTADWPLPMQGTAYWLIHVSVNWSAALIFLRIIQWHRPAQHRLYYAFWTIVAINIINDSFRLNPFVIALSHAYQGVERFLNRTPLLVLLITLGTSGLLIWWVQAHPLPVNLQDPGRKAASKNASEH